MSKNSDPRTRTSRRTPARGTALRPGTTSRKRAGVALIESCFIIVLLCFLLFGLLQVARLYVSYDILNHAAVAGARARAVGFNDFMVYKVIRAASIANAGKLVTPSINTSSAGPVFWGSATTSQAIHRATTWNPSSPQYRVERSRIPLYLGALGAGQLDSILDYADWDTIDDGDVNETGADAVRVRVEQAHPLKMPFHRAFYRDDEVDMKAEVELDSHYSLYLE